MVALVNIRTMKHTQKHQKRGKRASTRKASCSQKTVQEINLSAAYTALIEAFERNISSTEDYEVYFMLQL